MSKGLIAAAGVVGLLAFVGAKQEPEIRRYLKIRSM
jgi:hypothetical protein